MLPVRARHTRLVSGNVEVVSLFGLQQLQRRKLRVTCTSASRTLEHTRSFHSGQRAVTFPNSLCTSCVVAQDQGTCALRTGPPQGGEKS